MKIAVLIPCLNEEVTIGKVVRDFKHQLPQADIYVYDNNSTDRTRQEAEKAGAIVKFERRPGKGYVVQSMFNQVEADLYILVDGDDTYPAQEVHRLLAPVQEDRADMAVGSRLQMGATSEFNFLNRFGNWLFVHTLNLLFRAQLTDILSGYRVFNHRFVKGVPLFSGGFEIETELTIKALQRKYRIVEIPVNLRRRPEGSTSKISLVRDGVLIASTIMALFRDHKPLTFFGLAGLITLGLGLWPLLSGQAFLAPPGVAAVILILGGLIIIAIGMILHTIDRRFQELEFFIKSDPNRNEFHK